VRSLFSPTVFDLNGTYPTSNVNLFDFKKTSTSGTITPQRPTGITNAVLKVNRTLNVTDGSANYLLPGTTNSTDFVTTPGSSYRTGQRFLVGGGLLGGSSPDNDLIITVGSVSNLGEIVYFNSDVQFDDLPTYSGTADKTLDYSLNGTPIPIQSSDFTGAGFGAQFNIVKSGLRTPTGIPTYTSVTVVTGGNNYIQNNVIRISGSILGGITPDNDLYVKVLSVNSGAINGIAITGIASDSYAVAGFSTIYYDGTNNISRPFGLEKTADFGSPTTPILPPTQGAYLEQRQDMLSLAAENFGGVIKINKVYNIGSPQKSASITSLFVYGTMWFTDNTNDSEYVFDKSNTGICTIYLDDDNDDGRPFRNISIFDQVYIYDSLSPYLDYPSVGYAHTVTSVNSVSGNAAGTRDFITIQTRNYNATSSDDKGQGSGNSPNNLKIIKTNSPLVVHAPNHGFVNDEQVIIGLTTNLSGLPYETSTGLGNTSYIIKNSNTNTFEVNNANGRVTAGSILNGNTDPLIINWYDFIRGAEVGLNGEIQDPSNENDGNRSPFARIILAKGGRASVVGSGVTPIDNRVGLAKAIADFITQVSLTKN
jgi:hypothetical protein